MSTLPTTLPDRDFSGAKRRYLAFYAEATVQNHYLKVALLIQTLVMVALVALNFRSQGLLTDFRPLIVRIDAVGRAQAINYAEFEHHPEAPEIRYFLTDFVTRHYSRVRATFRDSYARSLYFLDAPLANAAMETNRLSKDFEAFLEGSSDEIDVQVFNVVLEDLRKPPYKAKVDFEKHFYGPGRTGGRRERHTATIEFVFSDHVPNELIPINPLGFRITDLRADQAFK